jgi:hypothetical protein
MAAVSDKEKGFVTFTFSANVIKLFYWWSLTTTMADFSEKVTKKKVL